MNGNSLPVISDTDCGRFVYSTAYSAVYWANKELYSSNFNTYALPGTTLRLLGCHGNVHYFFLTPTMGRYYLQSFAGARGGQLDVTSPCLDNEGYGKVPGKAAFYHEFSPLGYGVTRENNRIVLRNIFTGTIPSSSPVLELPNVGEGSVLVENISCSPAGAPFMKRIVLNKNPNAYGTVRTFMNSGYIWSNSSFYGYTIYPVGLIVFNTVDGYYYRATVAHRPGDNNEAHPANGFPSFAR